MDIIQGDVVELPGDLWPTVLAKLPVANLMRARIVCKRWKAIVDSESFNAIYSQQTPHDSFFIAFDYDWETLKGVAALRFGNTVQRNRWYTVSFSQAFLDLELMSIRCSGGPFLVAENLNDDIVVCNMFTERHRVLPPKLPTIDMIWSPRAIVVFNNGHYKVLAVWFGGRAQLYDSESNSWEMCVPFNNVLSVGRNSVYLNGLLYILSFDERSLIALDINGDRRWTVKQENMPSGLFEPFIMEHEGLVILVGGIWENRVLRSINVWKLDPLRMEWHMISTMPNSLLKGFRRPEEICLRIIGTRGKICFFPKKCSCWPCIFFQTKCSSEPCMYNLSAGKWVDQLPSYPNLSDHMLSWTGVAIEHRLRMEF